MKEVWDRIHEWLADKAALVLEDLNPGATEEEIAQAEDFFDVEFPSDLKHSYLIHNGSQNLYSLFPHSEFLSVQEMIKESRKWQEMPDWAIQSEWVETGIWNGWWHPHWIPFTRESTGICRCVDLAPAVNGTVGQIIEVEWQQSNRLIISSGFQAYMEAFANRLERGNYYFSEEWDGLDYAPH